MARCPFATWRPIRENATQGQIDPTQYILHTAVDAPGRTSLWGFFDRPDVDVESTFYIFRDGDIEQYLDTTVRADANRTANVRAISVETEDDGTLQPWTPAQMASIKRLGNWVMGVHPKVQRRVCPSHDQPGWGYHSMWGAPSPWTPAAGKTCPGAPRIAQFNNDIRPWLAAGESGGFLMALSDAEQGELYNWIKALAVACVPAYQAEHPLGSTPAYQVQQLLKTVLPPAPAPTDVPSGVNEAFRTNGSDVRQQIAGSTTITSLIELALQRSPTFQDQAAAIAALHDKIDLLLPAEE